MSAGQYDGRDGNGYQPTPSDGPFRAPPGNPGGASDFSKLNALIDSEIAALQTERVGTLQEIRAFLRGVHSTDNLDTARDKLERSVELLRMAEAELSLSAHIPMDVLLAEVRKTAAAEGGA